MLLSPLFKALLYVSFMSTETQVEELYGDTKDDEWKKEEVSRIKAEKGIETVDEPSINLFDK